MNKTSKIYVAGHRGMVGSAITRVLKSKGYSNLMLKTSKELDLRNQSDVNLFFETEKPEYVFLAAAKVGGILANDTYGADFLYENLMIEANLIHASYQHNAKKNIVFRVFLYLSKTGRTTYERGISFIRVFRRDQRTLCDCKNCWY